MNFKLITLDEIDSTNNYASQLLKKEIYTDNFVVLAENQTNGRGQRQNSWWTEAGKNLSFSLCLQNIGMDASKMFLLNIISSLSVVEICKKYHPKTMIKWPNDIFINEKKIGGILIENIIQGNKIAHTVIGIGLNINSTEIPQNLPHASSLSIESGGNFDLSKLLIEIIEAFENRWFAGFNENQLHRQYLQNLWKFKENHHFQDKNGKFEAQIVDVLPDGRLVLKDEFLEYRYYYFKEVEFLLKESA